MNIPPFSQVLKKSWPVILIATAVATLTAVLITFLITPTYQSELQILILPTDEKVTSANLLNPNQPFTQNLNQVLISNKTIEQLIDNFDLETPEEKPKGFLKKSRRLFRNVIGYTILTLKHGRIRKVPLEESVFNKLKSSIEAKVLPDSGVIELKVNWTDPKAATAIADFLAELFVDESKEVNRIERRKIEKNIDGNIEDAVQELSQSNRKLIDFRNKHSISESDFNPSEILSPTNQATYVELQEAVAAVQGNFLFWQNHKQESRARSIASEEQYQILGRATSSTYPASPFVALYAAVGLVAGMLAGLGLAVVANLKDEFDIGEEFLDTELEPSPLEVT